MDSLIVESIETKVALILQKLEELPAIHAEVKKTNGRVNRMEAWVSVHDEYTKNSKENSHLIESNIDNLGKEVQTLKDNQLKESGKKEIKSFLLSLLVGIGSSVVTAYIIFLILGKN